MVLAWKVWQIVVLYWVYKRSIPTIMLETNTSNSNTLLNITGLKTPNSRRQPVGYLEAWLWFWTEDNQEQIWRPEQDTNLGPLDWKSDALMTGPRFLVKMVWPWHKKIPHVTHFYFPHCERVLFQCSYNCCTTVRILVFLHCMEQEAQGGGNPIWNRRGCSSSRLGVSILDFGLA